MVEKQYPYSNCLDLFSDYKNLLKSCCTINYVYLLYYLCIFFFLLTWLFVLLSCFPSFFDYLICLIYYWFNHLNQERVSHEIPATHHKRGLREAFLSICHYYGFMLHTYVIFNMSRLWDVHTSSLLFKFIWQIKDKCFKKIYAPRPPM